MAVKKQKTTKSTSKKGAAVKQTTNPKKEADDKQTPKSELDEKSAAYNSLSPLTLRNIRKLKWFELATHLFVSAVEFEANPRDDDELKIRRILFTSGDFKPAFSESRPDRGERTCVYSKNTAFRYTKKHSRI